MARLINTPVAEWRQPPPRITPAAGSAAPARPLRARLSRALARVFEASEDENRRVILELVAAGPPRERLLDLGCFNGAFTVELGKAARASRVVGVEWLDEHAALARERGVEVVQSDLNEPLPFEDGAFDLVHANQLIEHLRSTDRFLREVGRVCAPDGRIILSTNNLSSWHNVGALVLGLQPLPAHVSDEVHVGNPFDPRRGSGHADAGQTHLRVFTTRALRELAAVHGLRVTAAAHDGYYPLPPPAARWAARLDGLHAAFIVLELAHDDAATAR
ncbi:MAG: class I SAM-dependent methyltransferase [Solirubrobacteraceae bacterium]|jgi:SAM-dependent methyltransferase